MKWEAVSVATGRFHFAALGIWEPWFYLGAIVFGLSTWRGVDAFTWMKHDGVWRIVALAYTDQPGQRRGAP